MSISNVAGLKEHLSMPIIFLAELNALSEAADEAKS
jgi:hypothetical protein